MQFHEYLPQIKILTLDDLNASNAELAKDAPEEDFEPETFEDFVNRQIGELFDANNKNISVEFRTNSLHTSTPDLINRNRPYTIEENKYVSIAIIHYSFPFKAKE